MVPPQTGGLAWSQLPAPIPPLLALSSLIAWRSGTMSFGVPTELVTRRWGCEVWTYP